jgi:hypothetical protein
MSPIRIRTINPRIRRRILRRDNATCRCCGKDVHSIVPCKRLRETERIQVHHVTWKEKAGGDYDHNLITLCHRCHKDHHDGKLAIIVLSRLQGNIVVAFKFKDQTAHCGTYRGDV